MNDQGSFEQWARRVLDDLVPKIRDSAVTVSLVPTNEADVKYAVELGLSIMLDKPIILLVRPGTRVPERLIRVADRIVEFDGSKAEGLADAIEDVMRARRDEGADGAAPEDSR